MNLRKLARLQHCQLQIPGTCNHNPETTVLAHIRDGFFGMGTKPNDDPSKGPVSAVMACSDCHDAIDRRSKRFLSHDPLLQKQLNEDRRFFIENALGRMEAWLGTS